MATISSAESGGSTTDFLGETAPVAAATFADPGTVVPVAAQVVPEPGRPALDPVVPPGIVLKDVPAPVRPQRGDRDGSA